MVIKNALKNKKLLTVSADLIFPNVNQPRKTFDEYELQSLSESIKQSGIIQPLTVRKTEIGYELIAGERRLRAAKAAGLKKVPCIVIKSDELTAAFYSITENLQRSDLTVFEEAESIRRLIDDYSLTKNEVAMHLGIASSTLSNKLRILRLDEELRERIVKSRLTERHARALIRLPQERQSDALNHIIAMGLNSAEAEKYIDKLLTPEEISEKPIEPIRKSSVGDIRIFTNSLSRLVETMVSAGINAKQEKKVGKDYIEYKIKIPKTGTDKSAAEQLRIC